MKTSARPAATTMADASPGRQAQAQPDQRPATVAQRQLLSAIAASPRQVTQRQAQPNRTGLPDHLKAGMENLSGHALDDVRVHRNSARPAQLQAHAYAQGTDIHLAPGQEKHLPHEAWHVVQQKQGRVKPTMQLKGVHVNDSDGLEKEADVMGRRAAVSAQARQQEVRAPVGVAQRHPAAQFAGRAATAQRVVQLVGCLGGLCNWLGISRRRGGDGNEAPQRATDTTGERSPLLADEPQQQQEDKKDALAPVNGDEQQRLSEEGFNMLSTPVSQRGSDSRNSNEPPTNDESRRSMVDRIKEDLLPYHPKNNNRVSLNYITKNRSEVDVTDSVHGQEDNDPSEMENRRYEVRLNVNQPTQEGHEPSDNRLHSALIHELTHVANDHKYPSNRSRPKNVETINSPFEDFFAGSYVPGRKEQTPAEKDRDATVERANGLIGAAQGDSDLGEHKVYIKDRLKYIVKKPNVELDTVVNELTYYMHQENIPADSVTSQQIVKLAQERYALRNPQQVVS